MCGHKKKKKMIAGVRKFMIDMCEIKRYSYKVARKIWILKVASIANGGKITYSPQRTGKLTLLLWITQG